MGLRGGGGNHRLVQCGKLLEWSAQATEKRQVCNINRFKCCSLSLVVYVHSIYSTGNSQATLTTVCGNSQTAPATALAYSFRSVWAPLCSAKTRQST
jgi:hypothetical protein